MNHLPHEPGVDAMTTALVIVISIALLALAGAPAQIQLVVAGMLIWRRRS
jgi:hypothetical protein